MGHELLDTVPCQSTLSQNVYGGHEVPGAEILGRIRRMAQSKRRGNDIAMKSFVALRVVVL